MAQKVWEDWKININDIEFARKKNGDRKRIGKRKESDVHFAYKKLRDENDKIIPGKLMEVAVKQFDIRSSQAGAHFPVFIHEALLQKHAIHPCIVRTCGGYWPSPEEVDNENEIDPFIVMERMTSNLLEKPAKQVMKSLDSKRRILRDVAEGIAHLHSRGIVHRDIKPENVLVNVARVV